jgi:biotin carboxylase
MSRNIFVVGLDDFNLAQLQTLRHASEYQFHCLIPYQDIKRKNRIPLERLLQEAFKQLDAFSGSIDAIVGYWDFPVSTMLPILRQRYGLPGPSLEAVLKCEHKYWSRCLQQEVVPAMVPAFAAVDPFAPRAADHIPLNYPFWLKPVKAASSHLGFWIHNREELERSLALIRAGIPRFAAAFNHILQLAQIPSHIAAIDGNHCIAEGIISAGKQCTLEGYVYHGEVTVYGIVDSIREGKHRSCFARYQYPSRLPRRVQARMVTAIQKVLQHFAYDNSPFNAEFYWSPKDDSIFLLEINSRISKSHCPLFKLVDGEYHHAVNIDVALGRRPDFPPRRGKHHIAAKFMLRRYDDGRLLQVPSPAQLEQVRQRFPDTTIQLHVQPGMRLSDLPDQDSYSYEIAVMFMGAANQQQLLANYRSALQMLPFDIQPQP